MLPAEIGKAWLEDVHQLQNPAFPTSTSESTTPLQSPHQAHPATQFAEEWRFISANMKNCNELVMYNIDIGWRKSAYVLCEHTMNNVIQKLIQNNIVEYMMFVEIMIKILKVSSNVHVQHSLTNQNSLMLTYLLKQNSIESSNVCKHFICYILTSVWIIKCKGHHGWKCHSTGSAIQYLCVIDSDLIFFDYCYSWV